MLPTWRRRQTMERHHHVQPVRICSPGTESQHRWNAASTAGPSPASSSSSLEKENAGSALPKSVECPPPPLHRRRTRIHVATEHMWCASPLLAASPFYEWMVLRCGDNGRRFSSQFQLSIAGHSAGRLAFALQWYRVLWANVCSVLSLFTLCINTRGDVGDSGALLALVVRGFALVDSIPACMVAMIMFARKRKKSLARLSLGGLWIHQQLNNVYLIWV